MEIARNGAGLKAPARSSIRKTWCGPYALAVILGVEYETAFEMVRRVTGRSRVQGVWPSEMIKALHRAKIKTKWEWPRDKRRRQVTLRKVADWMKPNRLYLVWVTRHYLVVDTSNWTVIDNGWENEWRPMAQHGRAGRMVEGIAEIRRITSEPGIPVAQE